jgi:hypothetical protein
MRPENGEIRGIWFSLSTEGESRLRGAPEQIFEEHVQGLDEERIYEQDETK